jgi:hypothetical protein
MLYELIDKKGSRKTGVLRHLADWLNPLAAAGVDMRPFVYDPEWGAGADRDGLLATGMEEEEVDEIMLTSQEDYYEPQVLLSAVESAEAMVLTLIRHEGERAKVLRDLSELKQACERGMSSGEPLQIFAIPIDEDVEEEEDDDGDEDEEG